MKARASGRIARIRPSETRGPAIGEERQERVRLERMREGGLWAGFADSQPGAIPEQIPTTLRARRVVEQVEAVIDVVFAERFLHDDIGGAGIELHGSRRRNRAEWIG